MKWFSNLKIKVKLIICFIILAVFTAIIGTIGISNMNTINKRANEIYLANFIPATELAQVQRNLIYIRSDLLLLAYNQDAEKVRERIDEIAKLLQENSEIILHYETTITNQEEQEIYNELNRTYIPNYRKLCSEVVELFAEGKNNEAIARIPELTAVREKTENGFDSLITLNKKYAEETNKKNAVAFKSQTTIMVLISLIGVGLAILLGFIVAAIISKPLNQLLKSAEKIADGDLDVVIEADTKDEVGILTTAFKKMTDNINEVMTNISIAAEQVASGSNQVSSSSMALSQGATEQASAVEELTASLEEIAQQTKLNANNANEANEIAGKAKANALQGNTQMKEMLKAMDEINNSSSSISKIIKVIDEIAFQTNILALNAAVEAARAGQHGKGFAVVAEEVRNLAARSANAAKETTDMIEGSIKKVEGGTKIANETADALNKIVEGVTKVANLVGDIAIASSEQASGIAQVNDGIMQVSEVVQTNSATSQESAAASEELSGQAEMLKHQVARFKLRRNSRAGSHYREMEQINPDVLRMLDKMNNQKKSYHTQEDYEEEIGKSHSNKVVISDREFGKY